MSDAETIAARRSAWCDAFNAEDIPAMSDFVTHDHLAMPPNQPQRHGLDAAHEFWREGYAMAKSAIDVRPQTLDVAGDLAIDRFDFDMTSTPRDGGSGVKDTGKCMWVWRRESDGEWRVWTAIWNSDLAQPGPWSGG